MSVLLLYTFRLRSSSSYWCSYTRRVASYTIVAKRLDGWRRHLVRK